MKQPFTFGDRRLMGVVVAAIALVLLAEVLDLAAVSALVVLGLLVLLLLGLTACNPVLVTPRAGKRGWEIEGRVTRHGSRPPMPVKAEAPHDDPLTGSRAHSE
ncbi:MAG TPA: hypothetical protein VGD16_10525 [Enterovirga sp.]